jgi:uncharacterized protein YbaR (Trm112 family)
MFIELVDALRCPVPHEESWLVASATRMDARHIVEGMLGCPVCHAEYPLHNGVVDFRRGTLSNASSEILPESAAEPVPLLDPVPSPDPALAERLAALLGLSDARGFAVLVGPWGAQASVLSQLVETPLVLVDPPPGVEGSPGVSVLRTDGGPLPLAPGAARGVAIETASAARVASAVGVLKVFGRLVASVAVPLPHGVRELARDDALWVGERERPASPLVALHVRRG